MRTWTEGALALAAVGLLGVALFLFSGESLGDSESAPIDTVTFDSEAAARGAILAEGNACLQCHTVDGTTGTSGPTWKGLAGSARPLESGEFVTADDVYFFNSIVDPGSQVVSGYTPIMPTFYADQLTEQEITDLVEYIKSLST